MIEVCAGVIIQDGRVLLAQRPASKSYPLTWETPGGKVEGLHESHHDAIRRELKEELDITVRGINEQALFCETFEDGKLLLLFYWVHADWSGPVVPREGQGWGWFTADDLVMLPLTPGNAHFRRELRDLIQASQRTSRPPATIPRRGVS